MCRVFAKRLRGHRDIATETKGHRDIAEKAPIPLKMHLKRLKILEKTSISLKKS
jgi:hypothetical protein